MATKFAQFRYGGDNGIWTSTTANVSKDALTTGQAFQNYCPITQLGIQAVPGTRFFLNYGTEPIIVGPSGIWEIDTRAGVTIDALSFDPTSLDLNVTTESMPGLIVDFIYEGVGRET